MQQANLPDCLRLLRLLRRSHGVRIRKLPVHK